MYKLQMGEQLSFFSLSNSEWANYVTHLQLNIHYIQFTILPATRILCKILIHVYEAETFYTKEMLDSPLLFTVITTHTTINKNKP